ncbi:hypothetical protein G647_07977 [Cladophialophora carrionii CBS 160.54]|uniref:Uncharacterized protein n=1 Tax=Cladophialophora carrionii CBS 160.54 TaxID=1279043 RepID=V9D432_9EURO|nr:uncharacterized protein G647_07977 [Cladophialophora carrionii CBS 160.54]ETI21630.1 hypothetical protein G647_07977 [Cladophialophora carrionii CBS 160.54]
MFAGSFHRAISSHLLCHTLLVRRTCSFPGRDGSSDRASTGARNASSEFCNSAWTR